MKSNKKELNILNKKNIIFEHEDLLKGIESIFCFKDGDFLVFKNTFSLLYDGKTFEIKLELDFLGALCAFCYISEDEFILIKDYLLTLYRFKNNRTACEKISLIHDNYLQEINKNLFKLSNNDLLNITQILLNPKQIRIFRRIEENNIFKRYELMNNYVREDIDGIINIEDDKFLAYKKYTNDNEINFMIYSNKDYKKEKSNRIKCIMGKKRMIYFSSLPIFKTNKKKILMSGITYLNIIDIDSLELETTIKVAEDIKDIVLLGDNCIVLFDLHKDLIELKQCLTFYLIKIWIDFESNVIIKKESKEITDEIGEFKTLFKLYNFRNNGIATITDQNLLKIYNEI